MFLTDKKGIKMETKFKAWSDKEERMISWETLISPEGYNCTLGVLTNQMTHHLTFLQYTNRKDRNRHELYKGDIFRCSYNSVYDFAYYEIYGLGLGKGELVDNLSGTSPQGRRIRRHIQRGILCCGTVQIKIL